MALIDIEYCDKCKKETYHTNGDCGKCYSKLEKRKSDDEFARWNALTIEQRIDELKEQLDRLNKYTNHVMDI